MKDPISHSYRVMPNSFSTNFIWATVSPFATRLARPFLIMSIASIPRKCSPSCRHRPVSFGEPGSSFHVSVILLDNIIKVFALAQLAAPPYDAFLFQALDCHRIGTVFIDVDHPWHRVAGLRQGPTKEAFRRCRITFGSQKEIDGLPRESTAR